MEIVEVSFELDPALIKSGLSSNKCLLEPRSPGTHQSDVLNDLYNVLHPGERKAEVDLTDDDANTKYRYFELGMLWEICLEEAFRQRQVDNLDGKKYLHQVEVEKDDIFVTTDAIHIPDWRVMEYKLTYRSMAKSTPDRLELEFWSWFSQIKSNCYVHDTRLASLFVLFLCGDWRPPVPRTKRWDIVFTDQELIENWNMITKHRDIMKRDGRLK